MGIADKYREQPLDESAVSDVSLDAFDLLLDGSFCRSIEWDGMVFEYIPLTMSELRETDTDDERLLLMLAKALKRKVEQGVDDKADILMDRDLSYYNNAKKLFNALVGRQQDTLRMKVYTDISLRENMALGAIEEFREAYKPRPDDKGPTRKNNPLDGLVHLLQVFRKTGYTVHDLANMTQLQYIVYSQIVTEANVREGNDHNYRMGDTSTSATKLPGKKFNGSS